jgi:hypothetical protein
MGEQAGLPDRGTQRRLTVALVASLVLSVGGRFAVFLLGGWLAVPFIIGFVAIVVVLTIAEARARRMAPSELLKRTLSMGRPSKHS